MASSTTEIANLALSHLGVAKEIANLETENSQEANAIRRFYNETRDYVLRDFFWPFATRCVVLGLVQTDPNDEWAFSYRVPSDYIRLRRIPSGVRNDTRQSRVAHRISQDTQGLLIFTDMEDASLEYTFRETNPARYPSDFVTALSFRLAYLAVPRLSKGDPFRRRRQLLQDYVTEISKAKATAANEEQVDEEPDSEFIRGRE